MRWPRILAVLGFLAAFWLPGDAFGQTGTEPASTGPTPAGETGRFISMTDIHFDPMAAGITTDLAASPPESWAARLDRTPAGAYAHYGADTTWPSLRSALDAMHAAEPNPAFLLLTGDLLAHEFRLRFIAATHDPDQAHFSAFVQNTVTFLGIQIAARFPGKRVFLALGNDDSDCGDYELPPGGDFLHASLPVIHRMLDQPADDAFDADWTSGRGYDVANGAIPGLRMVFVNSVFLSRNYRPGCGAHPTGDPGMETLDWLEQRLARAERAGDKVWLLLHIPPGADAYANLRHGQCPTGLLPMWTDADTRRFLDIAQRYRRTIAASFAGHTHMDEFRLIGRGGDNFAFTLSTPGISPIFGQNPGFDVYDFSATGQLSDRVTWYVSNLPETDGTTAPHWQPEYDFDQIWSLAALDLAALEKLGAAIRNDKATRANWFRIYRVGNTAVWHVPGGVETLPATDFRAYDCAIGHVDPDEYSRCFCDPGPPP